MTDCRRPATTMVARDEWVKTAMTDDGMVAELLMRLKNDPPHASASRPSTAVAVAAAALPPPRWGIRQPRSRMAFRCDIVSPAKRCGDSERNSPTTPLSWSAGTASSSGTADAFDDSALPAYGSSASRSKDIPLNDSKIADIKKSRKKKTYAELKEEENLLLEERIHLKKVIATLRATFKEQTTRNESLKRMKLDLNLNSAKSAGAVITEPDKVASKMHNQELPSTVDPAASTSQTLVQQHSPSSDSHQRSEALQKQDASFLLPDLNMMPSEEDPCSESLNLIYCGETRWDSVN